tara:strand:+ start:482 stop:595 length:114 start_codon:yes stop_codon:yes gene_type:complete
MQNDDRILPEDHLSEQREQAICKHFRRAPWCLDLSID